MAKTRAKKKATKASLSAREEKARARAREERARARARALAAQKAWKTRRANQQAAERATERRRQAAQRAWAARRERASIAAQLAAELAKERAARERAETLAKKAALALEREIEKAIEKDRETRERARKERIAARRKREEEERGVAAPFPPSVDVDDLLARARERTSRGQIVENVREMSLRRGGFAIIGNIRDDQGRAIRVRGYEIWIGSERYFYWGLRDVVGRFHPPTAFEHNVSPEKSIGTAREEDESMVLAWDIAS